MYILKSVSQGDDPETAAKKLREETEKLREETEKLNTKQS